MPELALLCLSSVLSFFLVFARIGGEGRGSPAASRCLALYLSANCATALCERGVRWTRKGPHPRAEQTLPFCDVDGPSLPRLVRYCVVVPCPSSSLLPSCPGHCFPLTSSASPSPFASASFLQVSFTAAIPRRPEASASSCLVSAVSLPRAGRTPPFLNVFFRPSFFSLRCGRCRVAVSVVLSSRRLLAIPSPSPSAEIVSLPHDHASLYRGESRGETRSARATKRRGPRRKSFSAVLHFFGQKRNEEGDFIESKSMVHSPMLSEEHASTGRSWSFETAACWAATAVPSASPEPFETSPRSWAIHAFAAPVAAFSLEKRS